MKTSEWVTRAVILVFCLSVVILPLALWSRTPLIHARMSESGGWNPESLQARTGEPLRLKFTSDDVVHGFAVGQMDMQPVDIEPGKISEVTLTFDTPGIYTFYCTRWCGLNHWRMRGTIEVTGGSPAPQSVEKPLYVTLGLNLDTPHNAAALPASRPNALNGDKLAGGLSLSNFTSLNYYRSHSPAQLFNDLRKTGLVPAARWDVVASIWQANTTPQALAEGREIYARNCAACHGENGQGNGVFASQLAAAGQASTRSMSGAQDMVMQTPADFSSAERILGASPALLQGKILRGGMGTGMPMWGSIFTEQQIWNVIAYLYSFQFEY